MAKNLETRLRTRFPIKKRVILFLLLDDMPAKTVQWQLSSMFIPFR